MKVQPIMRALFFGAISLIAATVLGAQTLSASPSPSHYSLSIVPDFERNTFVGDEFVDIHLAQSTADIQLNATELTFENAAVIRGGVTQTAKISVDKDKELATFSVESGYEPGDVTLHVRYRGVIHDSCCGFYRVNEDNKRYGVVFSSARQVFPSFDDPNAKATFDIAVTVDTSDEAISNGRLVSDIPDSTRTHHTLKFATTPPMSTYLVTFATGQFVCEEGQSDGVPIRVCGSPARKGLGAAALEAAKFTLHFYDEYFATKYPYGKLDFIGLPGIPGAMEDTGCILALDSLLFGRPQSTAGEWQRNMALGPVAHEMAHQWLGDLVTPKSDEDGWLSEGMATWMQYKAVAAWKPTWNVELEQLRRTFAAMEIDALASATPIRSLDAPDKLKYDKSAAVVEMIEAYVGPATFEQGINSYIARYAFKNAGSEDLWREIAAVSKMPVQRIAEGFFARPGIPSITLTFECVHSQTEIRLRQNRFYLNPSDTKAAEGNPWQIPVCFKLNDKTQCKLLSSAQQTFVVPGCGALFANSAAFGYYLTNYDFHTLRELSFNIESWLRPQERLALLNDVWIETRAGQENIEAPLTLIERMNTDEEPAVLGLIGDDLAYLRDYIVADSDQRKFRDWVQKTFAMRTGQAIRDSGELPGKVDAEVLRIAGDIGRDSEIAASSRRITDNSLHSAQLEAAISSVMFEIAAANGDEALYQKMRTGLQSSSDPAQRIRWLQLLAKFEDPRQIERTLMLLMSPDLSTGEARVLRYFVFHNHTARAMAWEFLKKNWKDFQKRDLVTAGLFDDLSQFCDEQTRNEIQQFFTDYPLPDFQQPLHQALTSIKACEDVRTIQSAQLKSWFAKQDLNARGK